MKTHNSLRVSWILFTWFGLASLLPQAVAQPADPTNPNKNGMPRSNEPPPPPPPYPPLPNDLPNNNFNNVAPPLPPSPGDGPAKSGTKQRNFDVDVTRGAGSGSGSDGPSNMGTGMPAPVAPEAPEPKVKTPSKNVPPGKELVSIDFPEPVPIKDIIKAVSQWTGKNFILPPNITQKVGIISPQQVTKEEAYQAFLSALNVAGFTTVDTGRMVKIIPQTKAASSNLKTFYGASWAPMTDEVITQIIPLTYIDANTIKNQLSKIFRDSNVVPFTTTNSLIVSDTGHKIRRFLEIIRLLDVKGNQPQVAIVALKNTDANEIAKKVREIYGGGAGKGSLYVQKISVDERTNSVVLIGPPKGLDDVVKLVKRLDRPLDDNSAQAGIHVRPLDYSDAEKLAATLQALSGGGSRRPISALGKAAPGAVADLNGVKITADKPTNSLIIQGSKASFKELDSLIKQLDKRRDQLFLEADIIDINIGNDFRLGMSLLGGATAGNNKFAMPLGFQAGKLAPFAVQRNQVTDADAANTVKAIPETAIFGVMRRETIDVGGIKLSPGAFIFAMKSDQNANVLQSPSVLVADNEEATFESREQEQILTEQREATGATTTKLERLDAVLSLKLKPQISQSDFINMDLQVKAEDFGTRDDKGFPRQTTKRLTETKVTVHDNQTIVISGLKRDREIDGKSKVPLLGDIPIIGWLFRNSQTQKQKTTLTVFITPHVVRDENDLSRIYDQKVKARDEFLEAFYGKSWREKEVFKGLPTLDDGKTKKDKSKTQIVEPEQVQPEKKPETPKEETAKEITGGKDGRPLVPPVEGVPAQQPLMPPPVPGAPKKDQAESILLNDEPVNGNTVLPSGDPDPIVAPLGGDIGGGGGGLDMGGDVAPPPLPGGVPPTDLGGDFAPPPDLPQEPLEPPPPLPDDGGGGV